MRAHGRRTSETRALVAAAVAGRPAAADDAAAHRTPHAAAAHPLFPHHNAYTHTHTTKQWEATDNKTTVVLYGAGAIVALWFANTLVTAINAVPVFPKLLELVGLGYTAWFTYRYLLFKSSREELSKDVDELKKKITGEF